MFYPKTLATVMASMAALASVAAGKDSRTFAVLHFHGDGPLTQGRSDPIVNPGGPSTHSHAVQGANAFGNSATGESLQESTCSTADIKADKSAYWMPTVYFHDTTNNSFEAVPLFYMNVYYFFEATNDEIKSFPIGLQMVSGNAKQTTPPASGDLVLDPSKGTIQPAQFTCPRTSFDPPSWPADSDGTKAGMQDSGNQGSGVGFPFANCDGYASPLRADLHFPSCYDPSKDLTDYENNMQFPSDAGDGKQDCPEGWVHTPHLFYEMYWNTPLFADRWTQNAGSQPFVLSNGDAAGYSLHGDFIAGWDTTVLQHIIDTCDAGDSGMDQCPDVETVMEGDCSIPNPTPEQIDGSLEKLPGNNPLFGWSYGTSAAGTSGSGSTTSSATSKTASSATSQTASSTATADAVNAASSTGSASASSSTQATPNTSGPTYTYGSNPSMSIVSSLPSSSPSSSSSSATTAAVGTSSSSSKPATYKITIPGGAKAKTTTGAGSASASYTRPILSYSSAPFANVSSSAAGSSSSTAVSSSAVASSSSSDVVSSSAVVSSSSPAPAVTSSTPAGGESSSAAASTPASGASTPAPGSGSGSGSGSACSAGSTSTTTITATETATLTATVTAGAGGSGSGSGSGSGDSTTIETEHRTTTLYVTKSRAKTTVTQTASSSSSASAGFSSPSAYPSATVPSYGNSTQFKRDETVKRNRVVRRALPECGPVTVTVTATETAFRTATVTAGGDEATSTGVDGTTTITTHRTSTRYVTIPKETTQTTVTPTATPSSAPASVSASASASSTASSSSSASVSALPSVSPSGGGTYSNGTSTHYKRAQHAHHHRHVRTHLH